MAYKLPRRRVLTVAALSLNCCRVVLAGHSLRLMLRITKRVDGLSDFGPAGLLAVEY